MMLKNSYSIQTTYDISEQEIKDAESAIGAFNYLLRITNVFINHLDKMMQPFKDTSDVPPEEVWEVRDTLKNFRDEAQKNLNKIQILSHRCVEAMKPFISDTQVDKIMKSFNLSMDDVTKQFSKFYKLFESVQDKDFIKNCVATIKAIKKEVSQLNQIIDERIQKYIEIDILNKTWIDNAGDLNLQIEETVPFEKELMEAQKNKLNK